MDINLFPPPSKELYKIVLDEKLRHGGHPVLRWMFENVHIESDAAGNIKPSKKRSSEKIDGAVGAIMAMAGATNPQKVSTGGIVLFDYDTGEMTRNGVPIITDENEKKAEAERRRKAEWNDLWRDDDW